MISLFRRLLAEWVEAALRIAAALVEGILRAPFQEQEDEDDPQA